MALVLRVLPITLGQAIATAELSQIVQPAQLQQKRTIVQVSEFMIYAGGEDVICVAVC